MDPDHPHLGKRALVTGASRGIGAGIERRLAADGADVAVNFRLASEDGETVAADVRRFGRRALAVRADIGGEEDFQRMVAEVEAAFGGIDISVNNAVYVPRRDLGSCLPAPGSVRST